MFKLVFCRRVTDESFEAQIQNFNPGIYYNFICELIVKTKSMHVK